MRTQRIQGTARTMGVLIGLIALLASGTSGAEAATRADALLEALER